MAAPQPAPAPLVSPREILSDLYLSLATQIDLLQWLIAVEALVAAQAVDLRKPKSLGRVAKMLHTAIRATVPPLHQDRATGPDVAVVRQVIDAAELRRVLANIGLTSL